MTKVWIINDSNREYDEEIADLKSLFMMTYDDPVPLSQVLSSVKWQLYEKRMCIDLSCGMW